MSIQIEYWFVKWIHALKKRFLIIIYDICTITKLYCQKSWTQKTQKYNSLRPLKEEMHRLLSHFLTATTEDTEEIVQETFF